MASRTDFRNQSTVYKEDELTRNRYAGLWRGRVEYNQDPLQRGRVKIRINEVHGEFEGGEANENNWWIPTEELPWAEISHISGGGYDYGSFIAPEVGSTCYVTFEKNDPNYPVVVGYWYASPEKEQVMGKNQDESLPTDRLTKQTMNGGSWRGKNAPEVPLEAQGIRNFDPTRKVLYKSIKGHTIYVEDRDEGEFLEIVDRTGQGIRIEGFVTKDNNVNNTEQRHSRSVFNGDPIERSKLKEDGKITIKDLGGSFMEFDSCVGDEKIIITGISGGNMDDDSEKQTIEMLPGRNKIVIESYKNDSLKSTIILDASTGGIEVTSENHVSVKAPQITLDGDVSILGELHVSGNSIVGGVSAARAHV